MRRLALFALIIVPFLRAERASAQTAADSAAIRATALNYVEGWYEGSGERMAKALHPDLVKRIVNRNAQGGSVLSTMGAETLVDNARRGGGRNTPAAKQTKNIRILDITADMAIVKAEMSAWYDMMQIAKWNGEWKIVNVLGQMKKP